MRSGAEEWGTDARLEWVEGKMGSEKEKEQLLTALLTIFLSSKGKGNGTVHVI